MNKLFDLLKLLYCIRFFAKDIHYTAKGENFYGEHLFADRIFDGIDGFIDDINENLYLGFEEEAPKSKNVMGAVFDALPDSGSDIHEDWVLLYDMITQALELIYKIEEEYQVPQINAVLDGIADDLQKKKGLIWRRILQK